MDHSDLADLASVRVFIGTAALWRFAQVPAVEVVNAAVQVLLAGVEPPSIVAIACLTSAEAESELGDHLNDLDLSILAFEHKDSELIAAAAMCRNHLQEDSDSQALTSRVHRIFGHDCHPLIEAISNLDDMFDVVEYVPNESREALEADTRAAAKRLVAEADRRLASALEQR